MSAQPNTNEVLDLLAAQAGQGDCLLLAVTGSRAYGTNHADSDWDLRGVWRYPVTAHLSLRPPESTFVVEDPDVVVHEVRKFVKLAANSNPSVLEVLWAPQQLHLSEAGKLLVARRQLFASKMAFEKYGGFANKQLQHALAGTGGSRGVEHFKRAKFSLHLVRLLLAGEHLLLHGEPMVRVPDVEKLREMSDVPVEQLQAVYDEMDARLKCAVEKSSLPDRPDPAKVDRLLFELYELV